VASYRLLIKPSAVREIEAVGSLKDRQRIVRRIGTLAEEPRPPGSQKLSGRELYRIRQGRYRIIYGIEDAELVVLVVKVGHRGSVYRAG
jgi:mRNA interferase RelE/StbE